MAVVARNTLMPAQQFVIGIDVVVEDWLFPRYADVTGIALVTAMFVVCVILEMAGHTVHVHLVLEGIFRVAVAARCIRVLPFQWKVRIPGMVET